MSDPRRAAPAGVPGPADLTDVTLPNGLRALVRENHASPAVVVEGLLFGGALDEPLERHGLASFMATLLERGTARHGFAELSDTLEAASAEISFGCGRHTLGFDAKCLAEDLPQVLGLLAEMLAEPVFPAEQVERVRGQILTALQQRQDNPHQRAALAFRALAYGPDHPYGRDTDGTMASVRAVGRDDLVALHQRLVHPQGGLVVLVGAIDSAAAVAVLGETLGAWSTAGQPPPRRTVAAPPPAAAVRRQDIPMPGKSQADIVLGNPAIPRTHPDWLAASLANNVLGVFGLMGRLGDHVRDQLGLAYHVSSRLAGGLGPGPWVVTAGVNPGAVDPAIAAIRAELHRLQDEPVPASELADVKAYVTGSLPLQLETNEGVAHAILDMWLYDLGLDYLERAPGLIAALTPADLQRAAQTHLLPDALAIAVAGPPA
jgi:zinc protease